MLQKSQDESPGKGLSVLLVASAAEAEVLQGTWGWETGAGIELDIRIGVIYVGLGMLDLGIHPDVHYVNEKSMQSG